MPEIQLVNVSKSYGTVNVCLDINLDIADREFVTLLGSSGCGKTTTLNMIGGLDEVTTGDILMDGRRVNDLEPIDRDVAMVFQNYALYPHMTVAQNIGFNLKLKGISASEIAAKVSTVAASLDLSHLLERYPKQLSGGQQQRVAIGRAIVRQPKVFLFDEPFSNLDAALRNRMRGEVRELHNRLGVTSIFVTHDQEEALSISDRVAVMNRGRIEQVGTPEEIYARPATRYVASFIGSPQIELMQGTVEAADGGPSVRLGSVSVGLPGGKGRLRAGQKVEIGIRPEHVHLGKTGIPATVRLVQSVGPTTQIILGWESGTLIATVPGFVRLEPGSTVRVEIPPEHVLAFDQETGLRL